MPKVSSVIVPYASYLRVYEPLVAFPEPERGHWARYARRPDRPSYQDELRRSLAALVPTPPVAVPVRESEDAFVAEVDGVVCVCPWRTRLRGWQALGELADGERLPVAVLDAVLPPVVRRENAADYERWRARHPDARPWIRTATWQVPLAWFVLVADEEREFRPAAPVPGRVGEAGPAGPAGPAGTTGAAGPGPATPADPVDAADPGDWDGTDDAAARVTPVGSAGPADPVGGGGAAAGAVEGDGGAEGEGPVLRYRTPMVQARRRVARGLKTLRSALDDGPLVEGVTEVGRWLEEFHPKSLVELDYGGLVHALPAGHLAADRSAADVAEGIRALREGDGTAAGEAYGRLAERWRLVRERQSAS
ncbi:hypothetical protein JNUCC64_18340 [Streptomyces sp. JNUCC 64]